MYVTFVCHCVNTSLSLVFVSKNIRYFMTCGDCFRRQPNGVPVDCVDTHSSNGTTVTSGIHSEQEEGGEGGAQSSEERYVMTDRESHILLRTNM